MNTTISEPCMKTTAYLSRTLVLSDQIECRGNNKKQVTGETCFILIFICLTKVGVQLKNRLNKFCLKNEKKTYLSNVITITRELFSNMVVFM